MRLLQNAGRVARREQLVYAMRRGLSRRRSCTLLGVARSALGYRSVKAVKDEPVLARMAALASQYPRFGYRRIRIFLGRDGHVMSAGRAHRLGRQAKLQVPRKRLRKRIASDRLRPQAPTGANQVWSCHFVFELERQRSAVQVPDRHWRMDQGELGDRRPPLSSTCCRS